MMNLIREISKLCMFAILWACPVILAYMFSRPAFLWLFILSIIGTIGVFSHYEDLEKIDLNGNTDEDEEQ